MSEATDTDLNVRAKLARKILNIQEAIGYVQKDKVNKGVGYKYVSAEAILKKVGPELVKQGVLAFPQYEYLGNTDGVAVQCNLTLVDVETGYSWSMASAIGCGKDESKDGKKGDKAVMKAETASLKYAWTGLLTIATGDDPEADENTDAVVLGTIIDGPGGGKTWAEPNVAIKTPQRIPDSELQKQEVIHYDISGDRASPDAIRDMMRAEEIRRAAAGFGGTVTEVVQDGKTIRQNVKVETLTEVAGKNGPYYSLLTSDGKKYNLFEDTHVRIAREAQADGQTMYLETVRNGKYENVKAIGFQEEMSA